MAEVGKICCFRSERQGKLFGRADLDVIVRLPWHPPKQAIMEAIATVPALANVQQGDGIVIEQDHGPVAVLKPSKPVGP